MLRLFSPSGRLSPRVQNDSDPGLSPQALFSRQIPPAEPVWYGGKREALSFDIPGTWGKAFRENLTHRFSGKAGYHFDGLDLSHLTGASS